jgi:hypothetical protein
MRAKGDFRREEPFSLDDGSECHAIQLRADCANWVTGATFPKDKVNAIFYNVQPRGRRSTPLKYSRICYGIGALSRIEVFQKRRRWRGGVFICHPFPPLFRKP